MSDLHCGEPLLDAVAADWGVLPPAALSLVEEVLSTGAARVRVRRRAAVVVRMARSFILTVDQ